MNKEEIKFRAWHFNDNLMLDAVDIHEMLILNAGQGLAEDVVLMQYTGLKDKNGKEIYEGDIVTARDRSDTAPFKGYVHYKNAQYFVNYTGYESYYRPLITMHGAEYEPIEIVGNIYELVVMDS